MDVDREIGNSAENCDETDYETDEEALGKISRKLSNNFPLLHYRNPKNNFNFVCIVSEIIFCFPVHVTIIRLEDWCFSKSHFVSFPF